MESVTIISSEHYNNLINKIDTLHDAMTSMGEQILNLNSKWMTTKQVCSYLNKSRTWVMDNKDDLGCSKSAGTLLFKRADVDAFIESDYFKKK